MRFGTKKIDHWRELVVVCERNERKSISQWRQHAFVSKKKKSFFLTVSWQGSQRERERVWSFGRFEDPEKIFLCLVPH